MPNSLTLDVNTNDKSDILRCLMSDGEGAYKTLARTGEIMTVEIFRDDDFLIKFTIPWSTRVQGKFLTRPDDPTDESRGDASPWGSSNVPVGRGMNPHAPASARAERRAAPKPARTPSGGRPTYPPGGRPHSPRPDHRAVGLLRQHLQQHRVRHPAVDDVHGVDTVLRGVERR